MRSTRPGGRFRGIAERRRRGLDPRHDLGGDLGTDYWRWIIGDGLLGMDYWDGLFGML